MTKKAEKVKKRSLTKAVSKKKAVKVLKPKIVKKKPVKKAKTVVKKDTKKKSSVKSKQGKANKDKGKIKTVKIVKVKSSAKEKKVGRILHYFDKIKVAVVKLMVEIEKGETIIVRGGKETDFKQKIVSMEINGEKIQKAKKGQEIGFKVKEKARVGYWVYKIVD